VLSAADFESLVRRAGVRLPPPFDTTEYRRESLPSAHQLSPDDAGPVIPSVAANLAVLARPELLVRLDADLTGGASRCVFAVAGRLGASLFALAGVDGRSASSRAEGVVELSMFAATWLGQELIRGLPDPPSARIHASLAPDDGEPDWAGRRVSRTALAEYGPARRLLGPAEAAAALGLAAADAELVAELTDRTHGTLRALVHGRPHGPDHGVLVGQVVWVATDAGWFELAPSDVDTVEVVPVTRERIGTRLAPMIAQVLAEVDDDAS
jgi:hypothetical protein